MSDSLGDGEGNPKEAQIRLYEKWAQGGTAVSFIGEVQIDPRFPEKPGNLVLGENSKQQPLKQLTQRATIDKTHLWAQLGHAGALSHVPISHPKGPSALDLEGLKCAGMTLDEVQALPVLFAKAAALAKNVGFSGVHIHAGHGFLLSQFLSPLFNHRTDEYGGTIEGRSRVVLEIINAVRSAVGSSYPVGIRINSTDQLSGGLTETDALTLVALLNETSIDLIDISGGTYFPGAKASSDGTSKGPYFLDFAKRAKTLTQIPLMVTGGFKDQQQAIDAVASGAADIVGLGRAMIIDPNLPNHWLSEKNADPAFPRFESPPPGGITAWYTLRITAIGEDNEHEFAMDLATAIKQYDERDDHRCLQWTKAFSHR